MRSVYGHCLFPCELHGESTGETSKEGQIDFGASTATICDSIEQPSNDAGEMPSELKDSDKDRTEESRYSVQYAEPEGFIAVPAGIRALPHIELEAILPSELRRYDRQNIR